MSTPPILFPVEFRKDFNEFVKSLFCMENHLKEGIQRLTGLTVQDGPFRSMRLPENEKSLSIPQILGCYEAELHPWIEDVIQAQYPQLVNIGCGLGFYAVGLAMRMPQSIMYAFDANESLQHVCRNNALANGVAKQVIVGGLCTPQRLQELITVKNNARPFLLIDCEGCEKELLDPIKVPALQSCDIIIETHDFILPDITDVLYSRFRPTHHIELIEEQVRDYNAHPLLRPLDCTLRWLAMWEGRPSVMHWLRMIAK